MKQCLFVFILLLSAILIVDALFDTTTCGIAEQTRIKIVNGVPSPVQFPWFAAFFTPEKSTNLELSIDCGGALVTSRHVITAGHCYKGIPVYERVSHFKVAFNMANRCGGSRKEVKIKKVIMHGLFEENWDPIPQNDVAIVVLMNDISNTPICLPTQYDYDRVYGITVGFGSITAEPSNSKFPCELMSANLLIRSREHCLKTNYSPETMAHRTVCAYSPGYRIDPCFADSGGPLMIYNYGRFELVGILSYGKVCSGNNWPKIYTDITDLGQGQWIKEQIFKQVSRGHFPYQRKHVKK